MSDAFAAAILSSKTDECIRLYKQIDANEAEIERLKATAPAWHDVPTCEGLWLQAGEVAIVARRYGKLMVNQDCWRDLYVAKWYGPIPEEPK